MTRSENRTIVRSVVLEYECDCCLRAYPSASYDDASPTSAGFALIYGEDEAGFGTHKYREHACSLECTMTLFKRHMAPHVDFPFVWARERKVNQ